ncbi:transposase [Petrocella sp. FN5]|uniref:transposase n=1 Tax=Petrocella sp. FN5 TaxID=3032002 RepID=UPI0023DB8674|nr:transposase [Petrocella sp. FN5]MDF1618798.1 transposase [Petrocella sp. FN5]
MSFTTNESQQLNLEDNFFNLNERTKKFVKNSWAKGFADLVFPAIDEKRFAVLYSDTKASRPNNPVNSVVGSLILKELFNLTDDELLASILCDIRFQYALHTTSFVEQPFSDRTFSRFRERLYLHTLETGEDLLQEEMESMAEVFVKYMDIDPSVKRMDSLMVSSSCKKMSRLEILYTCVANMAKAINKTGEDHLLKGVEHYLDDEDRNETIYHRKSEEISSRLQQVIDDAAVLVAQLGDAYYELPEYQLLQRVLMEQAEKNSEGNVVLKDKKQISPSSLQNPSDPDATFRSKAGKDNKGYVGNLVETFDKNGAIITSYDYQQNSHSDSSFCKETIEKLGVQETQITLIADGAYASVENVELATDNNIDLVTTALLGKSPDVIQADFQIDSQTREVTKCPAGNKPYKTSYYNATGVYRASFNKKTCENCSLRDQCGAKLQKKSAFVMVTENMVQRAAYLKKLSSEEYRILSKKRNGVEGLPSVLRRRYNVDHMPVRGLVRSKIWFSFKIGAINVKRMLSRALILRFYFFNKDKIRYFATFFKITHKSIMMGA